MSEAPSAGSTRQRTGHGVDGSLRRVLVANRGEIAIRVIRACRDLGIETVVATSTVDKDTYVARSADRAICIGPAAAARSYLNMDSVLQAALGTQCDAIHPGYGFLSENPEFAARCVDSGLTFVGPSPDVVAKAGDKARARAIAAEAGIPVLGGSDVLQSTDEAVDAAERLGFPVLMKAAAGGGGRGMAVVDDARALRSRFSSAVAEATSAFGDGRVYLERYVRQARHIEVQVMGDRHGHVVHLGERDCTLQRRHQKVVEEAPAPGLERAVRDRIRSAGRAFAEAIDLDSAGTVEFIYDTETGDFAFLEFNARIQVEHPVTEMITGKDLVQTQLQVASGLELPFGQDDVTFSGHAIEVRLTSESPSDNFMPRTGTLTAWHAPQGPGLRVDTHAEAGLEISPHYDSLLAKVIAHGSDRDRAIARLRRAMGELVVEGVPTTAPFSSFVLDHPDFRAGAVTTTWLVECGVPGYQTAGTASSDVLTADPNIVGERP